jgi:hypothetical protein
MQLFKDTGLPSQVCFSYLWWEVYLLNLPRANDNPHLSSNIHIPTLNQGTLSISNILSMKMSSGPCFNQQSNKSTKQPLNQTNQPTNHPMRALLNVLGSNTKCRLSTYWALTNTFGVKYKFISLPPLFYTLVSICKCAPWISACIN